MEHAVCIMAHKNVEQLNILIEILDHERIDIYLHIDTKSNIVLDYWNSMVLYSN